MNYEVNKNPCWSKTQKLYISTIIHLLRIIKSSPIPLPNIRHREAILDNCVFFLNVYMIVLSIYLQHTKCNLTPRNWSKIYVQNLEFISRCTVHMIIVFHEWNTWKFIAITGDASLWAMEPGDPMGKKFRATVNSLLPTSFLSDFNNMTLYPKHRIIFPSSPKLLPNLQTTHPPVSRNYALKKLWQETPIHHLNLVRIYGFKFLKIYVWKKCMLLSIFKEYINLECCRQSIQDYFLLKTWVYSFDFENCSKLASCTSVPL